MAKKTSYDLLFKLLLIGDSGVDKTSLMLTFTRSDDGDARQTFMSRIGVGECDSYTCTSHNTCTCILCTSACTSTYINSTVGKVLWEATTVRFYRQG